MVGQIVNVAVALILAVFLWGLFSRVRRSRNLLVRWVGAFLLAIPTLVVTLISIVSILGVIRLTTPIARPVTAFSATGVSADQVALAGKRVILCAGCHSSNGKAPMNGGGTNFLANGGPGLGTLYPPNLTPGGPLKDWTDGEIARAMREGIDEEGHPLLIMPADVLHNLSDDDTAATIAFLRSQPASSNVTPERSLNLVGLVLVGAGLFPTQVQPQLTAPVVASPRAVNAAYGKYLVDTTGCHSCHGPDLAGVPPSNFGGPPSGPNLTVTVPGWSEDGFVRTIRTGVDPSGYKLDSAKMPWNEFSAAFDDDQLQAIYLYIHGLTPIQK